MLHLSSLCEYLVAQFAMSRSGLQYFHNIYLSRREMDKIGEIIGISGI